MPQSVNDQSPSKVTKVFGVAKKISHVGLQQLHQLGNPNVNKINTPLDSQHVIEGQATQKNSAITVEKPQAVIRQYVPNVSKQLLGRHYGRVSQVATFISPKIMEQASDYLFEKINTFSEQMSSVQRVLDQAGVKSLDKLTHDLDRSARVSQALIEQNKWLATAQGTISGVMGSVGSGIDIPLSIFFALKTVYQTGRAYGFELTEQDTDVIHYIFKEISLDNIAEKQSILLAVRSISNLLKTQDIQKLQDLLGSSNDISWLKDLLNQHTSTHFSFLSFLGRFTPFVSAGVGGTYSWKLIESAGQIAQHVFSLARDYHLQHPDQQCSTLEAYQFAIQNTQEMPQLELKTQK